MKLMIVGANMVYNLENYYVKYLREIGVEVDHFFAQSLFYEYYHKNIINKIFFKAGFSGIYNKINQEFRAQVQIFNPDVIWVFKGLEISPDSLKWAKAKGIKLINLNADNPFMFAGKGSGNTYLTESIPLYDLHLTYYEWVKKKIEANYGIPTQIMPFGFDVNDELFEKCCKQEEIMKACFLGNPDKFRTEALLELANAGMEIDIYGHSWEKFINHSNIQIFGPLYEENFWLTLRKYRVQLNLLRPHNLDAHNMRSFEIPGVGGIELALDTEDHKRYFEPGKEIFVYTDLKDCKNQIDKILKLTDNEAELIRQQARNRSLSSGYSYKSRAAEVLKKIQFLLS